MVDELYEEAWLPLRNYFTPVMKLVEKQRTGSKVQKKYDKPLSPCDRLLACEKVSEETKMELRKNRAALDPLTLSEDIEQRLKAIFEIVEWIEEERREEMERAGENTEEEPGKEPGTASVTAPVANAPYAFTPAIPTENLVKKAENKHKTTKRRVS